MSARRGFHNPPALAHDTVAEILERGLRDPAYADEIPEVLVGSALYDEDRDFAEHWCVQVGTRATSASLRGLACLCLGHLARRFRYLSDEAIALARSLAARNEADPADVDGNADSGMDDIEDFLGVPRGLPPSRGRCRPAITADRTMTA